MNIYLMVEDGERSCVRANTMSEAVAVGLGIYLGTLDPEDSERYEDDVSFYHDQILESCQLIGELKN